MRTDNKQLNLTNEQLESVTGGNLKKLVEEVGNGGDSYAGITPKEEPDNNEKQNHHTISPIPEVDNESNKII